MNPLQRSRVRRVVFCVAWIATAAWASETEVKVTLFGRPCVLTGAYDEPTLSWIHEIGPERVLPSQSPERTSQILEKLRSPRIKVRAFAEYREKLARRIEAQQAFLNELPQSRKSGNPDALLALARKYARSGGAEALESELKKLATRENLSSKKTEIGEQLTQAFNAAIEPYPEEDFHRALKEAKAKYDCRFDQVEPGAE